MSARGKAQRRPGYAVSRELAVEPIRIHVVNLVPRPQSNDVMADSCQRRGFGLIGEHRALHECWNLHAGSLRMTPQVHRAESLPRTSPTMAAVRLAIDRARPDDALHDRLDDLRGERGGRVGMAAGEAVHDPYASTTDAH